MNFKNLILNESPVGKVGRTTMVDADCHLDDNPALISSFKKIVNQLGGKSVALRILARMNSKPIQKDTLEESKVDPIKLLRDNNIRVKSTNYISQQSKEVDIILYKEEDIIKALDLFDINDIDATAKDKTITIK